MKSTKKYLLATKEILMQVYCIAIDRDIDSPRNMVEAVWYNKAACKIIIATKDTLRIGTNSPTEDSSVKVKNGP